MSKYTLLLADDEEEVIQIIIKKWTGMPWVFQWWVMPATE